VRWTIAALLVAALVGCGPATKRLVSGRDGREVLRDAYDGRLDRNWSCGSLRAAYQRLPQDPPVYSRIPALIGDAAGKACRRALANLHVGDANQHVSAALGVPDRAARCWLYRWPSGSGSVDGARICFTSGRVARVQTAVHG
jgi:hypothetical protein